MLRGVARRRPSVDGANAPRWSLLGATLIAIFSFLPLYLAPSSVAEIVQPLFVVLALSLLLSWVLALTQTPLFGDFMLRVKPAAHDPYDTKFYRQFDRLLAGCCAGGGASLRWSSRSSSFRWRSWVDAPEFLSVARQALFPRRRAAARGLQHPRYGAQPAADGGVAARTARGEDRIDDDRLHAAALLPGQQQRLAAPQFRQHPVELHDTDRPPPSRNVSMPMSLENYPDVWLRSSLFKLSPVPDAAIEFGFIGEISTRCAA